MIVTNISIKLIFCGLLIILQKFTQCMIQKGQQINISNFTLRSTVTGHNHLLIIYQNTTNIYLNTRYYNTTYWITKNISLTKFDANYQIRTFELNNLTYSKYMLFNSSHLAFPDSNFITITYIYKTSSNQNKILDAAFGQNSLTSFALTSQNNYYIIKVINNANLRYTLNTTIGKQTEFYKLVYKLGKLFIILDNYIKVYQYDQVSYNLTQIFHQITQFIFMFAFNIGLDVQASAQFWLYFTQNFVCIYYINNMSVAFNYTVPYGIFINDVKFIISDYLLVHSFDQNGYTSIYQFDFKIGLIIAKVDVAPRYIQLNTISDTNEVLLGSKRLNGSLYRYKYKINSTYKCINGNLSGGTQNCTSCQITYGLNNKMQCQKNYSRIVLNGTDQFIQTHQLNISNISNNKSIVINNISQVQLTNKTAKDNPENSIKNDIQIYCCENKQLVRQILSFLETDESKQISLLLAKTLTLTNIRITPKYLLSLTYFINDLDIYQYHHKQYPQIMKLFINKSSLINEVRLNPWFLNFYVNFTTQIQQNTNFFQNKNQLYFQQLSFENNSSDPTQVYFLNSSANIYTLNLIQNVAMFLVLKVIHLLLFLLRNKHRYLHLAYNKLRLQTMWWTLVVSTLEVNMSSLSFSSAVQFRMPSFFSYEDKLNLAVSTVVFFLLLLYSLCFYPLVLKYFKAKSAQILLQRCKLENNRSFILEPIYLVFRTFLRSFVNGLFITTYQMQILSLLIVDIPFVIVAILMRDCFRNKVAFVICLFYSLNFVLFDGYFVVEEIYGYRIQNRQLFVLVLICMFLFFSLLLFFILIVLDIAKFYKQYLKSNQINHFPQKQTSNNFISMKTDDEKKSSQSSQIDQQIQPKVIKNTNRDLNGNQNKLIINFQSNTKKQVGIQNINQQQKTVKRITNYLRQKYVLRPNLRY